MSFAHPQFLWGLIILPVLIYFHFFREGQRKSDFRFPTITHLKGITGGGRVWLRHVPFVLRLIGVALLIVVMARPQAYGRETKRNVEGIDIILCLDTSGSMAAEDLKPSRIEAAKNVAIDFVKGRVSDRIGVVPFAGQSFTQCPLTTDYSILVSLIGDLRLGMVEDGTAIGMALATSVNRLRESKAKSRVIILLTDGQNNRGEIDPVTAAQAAQALGVRIYTVGVGTRGYAPFPVQDIFGKHYQNMPVDIDEDMLKQVASLTGGKYFRATDEKKLAEIYKEIDKLERTRVDVEEYRRVAELYSPWLWIALLCLSTEFLLSGTLLRKLP